MTYIFLDVYIHTCKLTYDCLLIKVTEINNSCHIQTKVKYHMHTQTWMPTKKEANMYDVVDVQHLSASSDQYDPTKLETNTYIEMKGVKDSTKLKIEYINTMI